jgi:hypothetical protein
MAGYALVVWDHKGGSSVVYSVTTTSPIGTSVLPTFVAERIRRETAESDALKMVRRVFDLPGEKS